MHRCGQAQPIMQGIIRAACSRPASCRLRRLFLQQLGADQPRRNVCLLGVDARHQALQLSGQLFEGGSRSPAGQAAAQAAWIDGEAHHVRPASGRNIADRGLVVWQAGLAFPDLWRCL
jgi:hypothetical protein